MINDKIVDDIVKSGIDDIDNEIRQDNDIRQQADDIIIDLLNNGYRTKARINDVLYLILLTTRNNEYVLSVYDIDKVYKITQGNVRLLDAMNTIGSDNRIDLSPKIYRPYEFKLDKDIYNHIDISEYTGDPVLNTLVSTAISYLLGNLVVGELP